MMENKRLENSVKSLVVLYTVVIAAALSLAVASVIDPVKGLESVTLSSTLLFAAFIATLFPFFHGALRHLDDAYIENRGEHIREGALVVDFALLFLHALAFVVLSLLLKKPGHFAWFLAGLLAIDVVWGIFAHFGSSSRSPLRAEAKWTIINVVFVGIVIIFLVSNDIFLQEVISPIKVAVPVVIACVLRSLVDYLWCKDFYFPK